MSSLIGNQVKTYMCSILVKFYIVLSLLLCHCSHLTDTTLIITITACLTQLFVILLTTATLFVHTQLVTRLLQSQLFVVLLTTFLQALHLFVRTLVPWSSNTQPQLKTDWLQLPADRFILPFYSPTHLV